MCEFDGLQADFVTIGVAARAVIEKISDERQVVQTPAQLVVMVVARSCSERGEKNVIVAFSDDRVVVDNGAGGAWSRSRR